MAIRLITFGYSKSPELPEGMHVEDALDARVLDNPHKYPTLRSLDGSAPQVQRFIMADPKFNKLCAEGIAKAIRVKVLAIGCYGGRHRSVAVALLIGAELEKLGHGPVEYTHYDIKEA